ncbi:MAG: glycoside hydrolase family 78 protein [Lachnospiraceae bacterium]|nr:glycoside hydrolase family 78 protein [Lachnospiraceae bacterium]
MNHRIQRIIQIICVLAVFLAVFLPALKNKQRYDGLSAQRDAAIASAGTAKEENGNDGASSDGSNVLTDAGIEGVADDGGSTGEVSDDMAAGLVRPVNLLTNDAADPLGVDPADIRFSWEYEWISATSKSGDGQSGSSNVDDLAANNSNTTTWDQTAYQIYVYEKNKTEGDPLWDSGIVSGAQTLGIPYTGDTLSPFTAYEWQVFCYGSDEQCYLSQRASFVTGYVGDLAVPFEGAQLITMDGEENVYYEGMPVYVKGFTTGEEMKSADKKLASAYFCVSALGQYEAYLNGEKIGKDVLAPGWTDYHDRLLYRVYDVTDRIDMETGVNHLAVLLGTGWWAGRNAFGTYDFHRPALIAQLILQYDDGSRQVVSTDESWHYVKDTAVRDADFFNGETFDLSKPDVRALSLGLENRFENTGKDSAENSSEGNAENDNKENAEGTGAQEKPVQISEDFSGIYTVYCGPATEHIEAYDRDPKKITVYEGTDQIVIPESVKDLGKIHVTDGQYIKEGEEDILATNPVRLAKGQTLIADLGQNMTGVPEIKVSGPDGCEVTVLFAEMLNDSGNLERGNDGPMGSLYRASYRSAETTVKLILGNHDNASERLRRFFGLSEEKQPDDTADSETADNDKIVTYSPSLFYTGFRYLSLTATEDISVYGIKGLFIGNASSESGTLETDSGDIKRLYENVKWSQRNNFLMVATDCPQRDERLGWMGDLGSFAATSMYNADLRSFYQKWADDLMDAQTPEGAYTDTVPATIHTGAGNGGWADAGIRIPLQVYERYGDKAYLEKLYPSMQQYMDYLYAVSDFGDGRIGPANIYGDWLSAESTDADFLCALWYGADAASMKTIAEILDRPEDAAEYEELLSQIKDWIDEKYIQNRIHFSQTEMLFLLHYDLMKEDPKSMEEALVSSVEENGYKVMTGFAGTPLLLPVLTKIGRSDMACRVLLCRENPSWLYSVDQGATTIWERYDSFTLEKGFADAAMNSFDHFNEGSVAQWMYESLAGISVDHTKDVPILISPQLPSLGKSGDQPAGLPQKVSSRYHSVYGNITVSWEQTGDDPSDVRIEIIIPPNTQAQVELPIAGWESQVLPGGYYSQ